VWIWQIRQFIAAIRTPFYPSKYLKRKQLAEEQDQQKYQPINIFWRDQRRIYRICIFLAILGEISIPSSQRRRGCYPKDLKAAEYYKEEEIVENDNNPVENLKELVKAAGKHETLRDFLNFIRKVQAASKS